MVAFSDTTSNIQSNRVDKSDSDAKNTCDGGSHSIKKRASGDARIGIDASGLGRRIVMGENPESGVMLVKDGVGKITYLLSNTVEDVKLSHSVKIEIE